MKDLKIGLVGAGFMAKAHSMAYATMPMFFWPAPAMPVRYAVCDIDEQSAKEAAQKFGYQKYRTNWQDLINDDEIDIIDIATPNDIHAEIAIAAAKAGKHVFCEKPIGMDVREAEDMLAAVEAAKVKHMLAFNYRRTPAILLAKKLIENGEIGIVQNFRGTYLQDWSASPNSPLSWRFQKKICGSGALGDIGTHVIDIARYLVGEVDEACAMMRTYIKQRPIQTSGVDRLGIANNDLVKELGDVDVDDEVVSMLKFKNGAIGSLEATRNAWGRNNFITLEIHGDKGSIYFNYERRDELQVCFASDRADVRGFRTIYTGPNQPYGEYLWPIPALGIGYGETKIIECYDFFKAIINDESVDPNFADGLAIAKICDTIERSSGQSTWVQVN